ncbi:DNA-binding NarL/FixJ family response regulator [Paraperlucidibaca baekdonensis]|uniref:DNA-binding NarL/FixJ family response regulator n=1 Tax=Paraperlucidibaca baekdonensis TaxID=748120 RepID=A0A3E0H9R9_9GAMM|nr:response regulator transcription factor [Paraperlucidibaca baekdonensis]REH40456.1 DNA-binding NarL/FixJ family response regulator [Paraperlucidibaca baekdonensis]
MYFVIADDHPLFRDALKGAVARLYPDATIAEADTTASLQTLLERGEEPDLLLLDLHMPGASGFSGLIHVRARFPALPVIVVSGNEEPGVMRRAVAHGASGYIPKSTSLDDMAKAIAQVLDGDVWLPASAATSQPTHLAPDEADIAKRLRDLTPQQFRVLMMLADGLLNKQIAYELGVSEATIKAHMTAILKKLGASNRTQAVVAAAKLQLDPSMRLAQVVEED